MKALVIGASSFIGAYTIDELVKRGIETIGTGRKQKFKRYYDSLGVPYLPLDINDSKSFSRLDGYSFDCVINYAVRMPADVEKNTDYDDTAEYVKTNVIGELNILEFCRRHRVKRVVDFISRFDIRLYDVSTVINEDFPLKFSYTDDHAAYVMTNNGKAEMLRYYNEKYGFKNIWFRIPSIYGVGPHGSYSKDGNYKKSGLQTFIDKAKAGEIIEVFGSPNTQKDIVYVKDVAIAVAQAIQSEKGYGMYQVAYDNNFTLMEMVEAAVEVFGCEGNKSQIILRPDIKNNGGFPRMDNKKIKTELGWTPAYNSFKSMMEDWKMEEKRGVFTRLFGVE